MAELTKVSPNRMELLKSRRRLTLAKRGHKLLKDKYDELIRRFLQFQKENKELRFQTENSLRLMYEKLTLLRGQLSLADLLPLIESAPIDVQLNLTSKNLLNTKVPVIQAEVSVNESYPPAAPLVYDSFVAQLKNTIEDMTKLAQYEQTLRILAAEIEKTRRRVNALEFVLIPSLTENVRFISMKMDELDRETRTRLMKIKDILVKTA